MTEYQLKHRTVEAQRFSLDRVDELAKWAKGRKVQSVADGWWIVLGPKTAVPGDYIIRLEDGSHYPMSADQFEDQYEIVGGTQDREYVLARLLAKAEVSVPEIHLPESAFAEGYYVELGEHRFTQAQWEAIQLYASGVAQLAEAEARDEYEAGHAEGFHMGRSTPERGHKAQRQNREFHEAMGIYTAPKPRAIPLEDVPVVMELIREEFIDELIPALGARVTFTPDGKFDVIARGGEPNVVEIYDALIDILYVTYGALNRAGMDAEPGYDEVQASNMSKLGADGKAIIAGENDPDGIFPGRVKKGPNYFKPNLTLVLTEQGWQG